MLRASGPFRRVVALALCLAILCGTLPAEAAAVDKARAPEPLAAQAGAAPVVPAAPIEPDALSAGAPLSVVPELPPAAAAQAAAAESSPAAESAAGDAPRTLLGRLSRAVGAFKRAPAGVAAALGRAFDRERPNGGEDAAGSAPISEGSSLREATQALFRLRRRVKNDAIETLESEMGGQNGDAILYRDVRRVFDRLLAAQGRPPESGQLFIGNSFLPNAFTMLAPSEREYLEHNAHIAKAFRISNTFISLGLLRSMRSEAELAFVLAHELSHNAKGHLKDFTGGASHMMLGHFHEFEADSEALKLVAAAGYDPRQAMDTLYGLDAEYKALEKRYALFKRRQNDVAEAIQRLRDVHPHSDLRRANMIAHLDEALELYKPKPVRENPVWMRRRDAAARPSHLDRFEARLYKALDKAPDTRTALIALERIIEKESAKDAMSFEKYAAVEEAYRELARRGKRVEDIHMLQVSAHRERGTGYPTRKLTAGLTTRRLDLAFRGLSKSSTLEDYLVATRDWPTADRRAGALRVIGSTRSRAQLDSIYRVLSYGAESIGLLSDYPSERTLRDLTRRLWPAARGVLTAELGRPAKPEEIVDELVAQLPASFLKTYREGFNIEILDSAFGPQEYRSQRWRPSELAARLEGRLDSFRYDDRWNEEPFDGALGWRNRHYTEPQVGEDNGQPKIVYERYRLDGLNAASMRDALDAVYWFREKYDGEMVAIAMPPRLNPPLLRLLRRDGKFDEFLHAYFAQRVERLKTRMKGAATPSERSDLLGGFDSHAKIMLDSALYEARDLRSIREVAELAWAPIEAALTSPELSLAYADSNRSKLVDRFLETTGDAVRRAVVRTDMAGTAPDRAEIEKTAALVRRIEAVLRADPASALVNAHARNLSDNLDDDRAYMKAYGRALDRLVGKPESKIWDWVDAVASYKVKRKLRDLVEAVAKLLKRLDPFRPAPLPGVPEKAERMLSGKDFMHFLAAVGDPSVDARMKLMDVALLDRLDANASHGKDDVGRDIGLRASAAVGRWLLSDVVSSANDAASLRKVSADLLRLYDLHPALLQPDFGAKGTPKEGFRVGAQYVQRSEAYLSMGRGEHPFRGVNARWALELFRRLDAAGAWPEKLEEKLDLLDALNSTGEFSSVIDQRIAALAKADPKGFRRWIDHDEARARRFTRGKSEPITVKLPMGQQLPLPVTQALRVVRDPQLRAKLFDALAEADMGEKTPRRGLRETARAWIRLAKAYWHARKYFSAAFLEKLRRAEAFENKIFDVLEEVDRVASERAQQAGDRWKEGRFTREDAEFLAALLKVEDPAPRWRSSLPHEKEELIRAYKEKVKGEAMAAVVDLYNAFAQTQDPVLALILRNYPEPTRARDELIERLIKARRLRPEALTLLESNKSYRMPNPVRVVEKQLLDQAVIQLRKFSAAEKVDLLLHMAKLERLSPRKISEFNRRLLNGDRRKLARDYAGIKSLAQLEDYLAMMHRKDRALMVKSMFYGEKSLSQDPEQGQRLFERLVIQGRDLPPFMQRLLRAYFKILNIDERAQLISDIAAIDDVGSDLSGPEIMKVALKNGGVTGAKIAQVLATHKGVIPAKYADYLADLEGFKEKAQEMEKMRAHDLVESRIAAIEGRGPEGESPYTREQLRDISLQALPGDNIEDSLGAKSPARDRLVDQVHFLLRDQKTDIDSIEAMGPELGAGSIKLVYKVTLKDGRVWVAKLRAPGAAYKSRREFQIIDDLIAELERTGDLDLPGIRQLVDEVRSLVMAEMNFRDENAKELDMLARVESRPWYARLIAPRPYVPRPHPLFVSEDLMIEEFVPTIRFSALPRRSLIGPSQRKIAGLAVQEGMFDLVFGEWLEPDPHTGNRHARAGGLYRLWTKLVVMDLGQGVRQPIGPLKPLMKAGVAVEAGDAETAARRLVDMVTVPPGETRESIIAAIAQGVRRKSGDGVVEALTEGLLEAEKKSAIVKAEYAALQKAFLIYAGYSPYLPKDFAFRALQRAAAARVLRDRPWPLTKLARLGVRRLLLGPNAVRADMDALIDAL